MFSHRMIKANARFIFIKFCSKMIYILIIYKIKNKYDSSLIKKNFKIVYLCYKLGLNGCFEKVSKSCCYKIRRYGFKCLLSNFRTLFRNNLGRERETRVSDIDVEFTKIYFCPVQFYLTPYFTYCKFINKTEKFMSNLRCLFINRDKQYDIYMESY